MLGGLPEPQPPLLQGSAKKIDGADTVVTQRICHEDELYDGEMREVEVAGRPVLLVREHLRIRALGSRCPHGGAPLCKGYLARGRLRCPWHGACFSTETGDIEEYPTLDCLPVFHVAVKEGQVYVSAQMKDLESSRRVKPMAKRCQLNPQIALLLGAGPAALTCAETLRQGGFTGRIIMATWENHLPYDRTKLSKELGATAESIYLRSQSFLDAHNIEVWKQREVVSLDLTGKMAHFQDGTCQAYDNLLIATGSSPQQLRCPGSSLENVCTLLTPEDAHRILDLAVGKSVVIVGASFTGMVALDSFSPQRRGQLSTLPLQAGRTRGYLPSPQLFAWAFSQLPGFLPCRDGGSSQPCWQSSLPSGGGKRRAALPAGPGRPGGHRGHEDAPIPGSSVPSEGQCGRTAGQGWEGLGALAHLLPQRLAGQVYWGWGAGGSAAAASLPSFPSQVTSVLLSNGSVLPADLVVVGIGVTPNSNFVQGSSIRLDHEGAILVDLFMQTSAPSVFAAGDVASFPVALLDGKTAAIRHWQIAQAHGHVAALNMLQKQEPLHTVPFFWTRLQSKSIRYAGCGTGYTETVLKGDLDQERFLLFYVRDGSVTAVASLNFDPLVVLVAETLYSGKSISKQEAEFLPETTSP
ncbi:apoptosis-inducing factor 3-like isoform X2 [Python bivittatus]|uniref:L-amino-acid oxidase n=1 Tax=Python bivittatus TaxID=176946 RepID=A0A9F5J4X1_PYTBI|nr:apoptosis-inducing factor 3-like isoform X2 [Python bivittatus]